MLTLRLTCKVPGKLDLIYVKELDDEECLELALAAEPALSGERSHFNFHRPETDRTAAGSKPGLTLQVHGVLFRVPPEDINGLIAYCLLVIGGETEDCKLTVTRAKERV
jgi:hypothetical protein